MHKVQRPGGDVKFILAEQYTDVNEMKVGLG